MSRQAIHRGRAWLFATVAAAALYVFTAAPGLLWGDSGDAQLRLLLGHFYDRQHLSRSHILFYIVAAAVARLGFSTAYAATLVSALAGAVTVGNTCWLISRLTSRRAAVFCGTAALACSHSLWHLSTVAEVMTLSTALLSLELCLLAKAMINRDDRWLVAACLVNGLGLSAHSLSLLMWPAYGTLMVYRLAVKNPIRGPVLVKSAGALLLGSLPFIGLFIHLTVRDGRAAHVFVELLAGRYAPHVFNVASIVGPALKMAAYTVYSFPTPLLLCAIVGVGAMAAFPTRAVPLVLLVAMIFYGGFALRYNVADQHVFMIHSYLLLAVLIGLGVDRLCTRYETLPARTAIAALSLLGPIVYLATPLVLTRCPTVAQRLLPDRELPYRDTVKWFLQPWHRGDDGPERFARELLDSVPQDGVLMIDSTPMPPLLYLQNAEQSRRDVRILGGHAYQAWFNAPIDIRRDRDALVDQGRLFVITPDRSYWNYYLRDARYQAVPAGALLRIEHSPHP